MISILRPAAVLPLAAALLGAPAALAEAAPGVQAGTQAGMASWYGPGFHGRRTASGERFDTQALTAAHRTLRFGTRLRVTNRATGLSVEVRINDRGPFARGRVIDLSHASARAIGLSGLARVSLDRL